MITILGVPETIAAFERVALESEAAKVIATQSGGQIVAAAMRADAPKLTGRLAAGINVRRDGDDAIVGTDVAYDRFVQRGTRYMTANPYGELASEQTKTAVQAVMATVFHTALR